MSFASCMRANGVNVPAPNTSGNGPLLNIKGIDTKSPKFLAARTRCVPQLKSALTAAKPPSAAPRGR